MSSFLKLVNLIYIPLALLAHWLMKTYLVEAFTWPLSTIVIVDILMIFAFALRLSKRQIKQIPILRYLIPISLLCFSFFSFLIPFLLGVALLDLFAEIPQSLCLIVLCASIALTFYQAWRIQTPILRQIQIPLPEKAQHLKGLSFVHISDLHLGPFIGKGFALRMVQQIQKTPAQFVCLTGDLMDGPTSAYENCVEPLKELTARMPVYFVTGNHEYYYDADEWIQKLHSLGVAVLRSEIQHFSWKNTTLPIAGIDDSLFKNTHEEVLKQELAKLSTPCLLLSHRPEAWDTYKKLPVFLQLSGHGHGGQAFPWAFIIRKVMKYPFGLFHDKESTLFVHSGTGFWGPPNRWFNPPEVCRIEFV